MSASVNASALQRQSAPDALSVRQVVVLSIAGAVTRRLRHRRRRNLRIVMSSIMRRRKRLMAPSVMGMLRS